MKIKLYKKGVSLFLATIMIANLGFSTFAETGTDSQTVEATQVGNSSETISSLKDYKNYIVNQNNIGHGNNIGLTVNEITQLSNDAKISENVNNSKVGGVVIPDDGYAKWRFTVEKDSAYIITVNYMANKAASGDMELALKVDGSVPFKEVSLVGFKRTYKQSTEDFATNVSGDDIKPKVSEVLGWKNYSVSDTSGYITTPFQFVFSAGTHSLEFYGSRGEIAINKITLEAYDAPVSYEQYKRECEQKGYKAVSSNTQDIIIEGEKFTYKSAQTVLTTVDHASAATYPQSAVSLKLNTVGGDNWKNIGESIIWDITVEKSGLYTIAPRFKQNLLDGIFTSRKLTIDGNIPFAGAAALRFHFSSKWQTSKLCNNDGEDYLFYLEAGKHTITLEAVAGDVAEMIGRVEVSINSLNKIYRRIVMITGNSPDIYRDYGFPQLIPNEIKEMANQRDLLQEVVNYIDSQAGTNGSYTSIIKKIIFQLDKMAAKPSLIAKNLEQFQTNLGSMSSWLLSATQQPLQIDRIYIMSPQKETPKADKGFLASISYDIKCFFASFFKNYNAIGQTNVNETKYTNKIKVWVQTGRDQAEIIRQLVDTNFADKNQAQVTIELVAGGTLLQSVLAGISPDVVMDNAASEPINYALRNAVVDLSKFDDYEKVKSWFCDASLIPYTYKGKVYALPQTFAYYMLFYRKDIFEEYGLKVPKTWSEVLELIPTLERNNLEFGMPHDINAYAMLLYQNGGELYKNNGEKTNINSNTGINTFVQMMEYFTQYGLPVTYDFSNRFRSGEMPCAIQFYSEYNQLTVFAPEIKGLWEMIPIPGTIDKNGHVVNTSIGTGSNMMMIKSCKNQELAWKYMKWFMSTETQSIYGIDMESVLGSAAKVATANVEALSQMTWSSSEYKNMFSQQKNVSAVPEVPGGYYHSRILSFAFNRVYNSSTTADMAENPTEVLTDYVKELNEELARKSAEFNKKEKK